MKLIPKTTDPVIAVRVTADLNLVRGNWLLILPGDVITQLSEEEVRQHYLVEESAYVERHPEVEEDIFALETADVQVRAPRSAALRESAVTKTPRRYTGIQRKSFKLGDLTIGAQIVRSLGCLYAAAGHRINPRMISQLRVYAHEHDRPQLSSRLREAVALGLAQNVGRDQTGDTCYQLTEEGVTAVQTFGAEAMKYVERKPVTKEGAAARVHKET